jgi:hypothetical protein
MEQTLEETNHTLSTLIIELENRERNAAREKYCKDTRITNFMDAVQAGLESACSPISMASATNFLDKVPTAFAHIDPRRGLGGLLRTRIGQIRDNMAPEKLHASTRILVMAKPADDSEAGRTLARNLASQLISDVIKKALPQPPQGVVPKDAPKHREVPVLGPYLLPCELSQNIGQLYKKPYYRPIEGEPKIGQPDVFIFIFVSPC